MREHQIIISLKPDQFLEIQRMARAANAKSMGIFVRQQLLSALGIEQSGSIGNPQLNTQDVREAVGQIKRLHGELKTFVAESLSLYSLEPTANLPTATVQEVAQHVGANPNDALETLAEKTFAISPRLGAISDTSKSNSREAPAANQPNSVAPSQSASRYEQRRDGHRFHHTYAAASELLDVPYRTEESAPKLQDPLEKLLPPSDQFKPAAPREPAAAAPAVPAAPAVIPDMRSVTYAPSLTAPDSPPPPMYDAVGELDNAPPEVAEYEREEPSESQPASAAPSAPDAGDADANLKPNTGKPVGYPSFSGSPPPKRRQV